MTPDIHAQAILRNLCDLIDSGSHLDERNNYLDKQCSKLVGYGALGVLKKSVSQSTTSKQFLNTVTKTLLNEIKFDCAHTLVKTPNSKNRQRTIDVVLGQEYETLNFVNKRMQLATNLLRATGDQSAMISSVEFAESLVEKFGRNPDPSQNPRDVLDFAISALKNAKRPELAREYHSTFRL